MKYRTEREIEEMRAYIVDFVESFEPRELAQAIKENIISLEEIEEVMRKKLDLA